MLIIPSIIALDTLGEEFDLHQNITITQVCSDATYINITSIQYPDGSRISINEEMTKDGGDFIYYFADTGQLGRYDVRGVSDGCTYTFAVYFTVGKKVDIQDSIFFIFLLLVLIGILAISIKIITSENLITFRDLYELKKSNPLSYFLHMVVKRNLKIFGYFGAYLSIWLFSVILNMGLFYLNFTDLSDLSKNFVILTSWGLIPFTLMWIIWIIIFSINSLREIKRFEYGGMKG